MLYGIAYMLANTLMLVAAVMSIVLCFMKYETSARLCIEDLSIKLRIFSFAFIIVSMMGSVGRSYDMKNYFSFFAAAFIIWLVVWIFSLIARKPNPLKVHAGFNFFCMLVSILLTIMIY